MSLSHPTMLGVNERLSIRIGVCAHAAPHLRRSASLVYPLRIDVVMIAGGVVQQVVRVDVGIVPDLHKLENPACL